MVTQSKNKGFTLIELMITIAIVGILAAVAIPSYQEYIIRSKVSEAVTKFGTVKTNIAEYFMINERFPTPLVDNFMGFIAHENHEVNWGNVKNFEWNADVRNGAQRMWVRFELNKNVGIDAENEQSSKRWVHFLVFGYPDGSLKFKCGSWETGTHIDVKYLPSSCQNADMNLDSTP